MRKTKKTADPKDPKVKIDRPAEERQSDDISSYSLEDRAKAILEGNDQGAFTIPAQGIYPHQWLWDSCFIAIGMRNYDVDRAKTEILSLLRGQWSNGMLPHMILNPINRYENGKHLRDGNIWRSWLNPNAPDDVVTSGITQPPMLAEAIVRIGEKMKWPERRAWYKMVYQATLAYHQWLYNERDPHHEGLVLQITPWETGLDTTPTWVEELQGHLLPWWIRIMRKTHLDTVFGWFRADTKFVPLEQRESNIEALALYSIQRRFRRKGYDFDRILDHNLLSIEDLNFNCIFIRANNHLRHIAKSIQEELPDDLLKSMKKTEKALEELWDPLSMEYFSRDFLTHKLLKQSTIAALLPLYAGCISQERAEILVKLLENEHRFGPAYPVPSVSVDSPWFKPKAYWQGPTWVNMNWLIIDGLKRYKFNNHAAALIESTLELVQKAGFYEYFSPIDGTAGGTDNFSWTAALTIDLLKK